MREPETEWRNMRQIKGITYDKSKGRCEHPKYQKSKQGNENKIPKSKMGEQEQDTKSLNRGTGNGTKDQKSEMGEQETRCKLLLEFAWRCGKKSRPEILETVLELLGSNNKLVLVLHGCYQSVL